MEGTSFQSSWAGRGVGRVSDTDLTFNQVPPQLKTSFHHPQDKESTSRAGIRGRSRPHSGNLSGLICSPTAFILTSLPLLLQCPLNYTPCSPSGISGLPHNGLSLCASLADLELGRVRVPKNAGGVTFLPLLTGKSLPLSSLSAS